MDTTTFYRRTALAVALIAATAVTAVTAAPTPAAASVPLGLRADTARHVTVKHHHYRQLLGTVTTSTYLEASTPRAGTYAIEYDVTGTAFFDTYVQNTELGYVGGTTGVYLTRPIRLTAGGHLVQAVGPEGSGSARVYLVQTS